MTSKHRRRPKGRQLAKAIAARVRQLRAAWGWSQEQLASEAGLSKGAVSRIERGDRAPRIETLERVAIAVGIPLSKLVDIGEPLPRSHRIPTSERRARWLAELQKSLDQLSPWLAESMFLALGTILRSARDSKRRSGGRTARLKRRMGTD